MSTVNEIQRLSKKSKKRKLLAIFSIFLCLLVAMGISISLGAGAPRFSDAINVIFSRIFPFLHINPGSDLTQMIVWDIRLPRVILAIVAGAGLAASGATMQGLLRNPLVSSYTLGISAGAGFGAALAIVFQFGIFTNFPQYMTVANAFIFALFAMSIVYGISRMRGITPETVILAGVSISYLFSALISLIQYVAPDYQAVRSVVFWILGSLVSTTWTSVYVVLPFVAIALIIMLRQSWDLNVLSLGEDVATSLGVNSKHLFTISMVLVSIATASIVSFTGVIGFVCLVAPHLTRLAIGNDHRFLLPCSAAIGACLLLCSDTVARMVILPSDLPIGIVTSLIGVPFFIYLILRKRQRTWF